MSYLNRLMTQISIERIHNDVITNHLRHFVTTNSDGLIIECECGETKKITSNNYQPASPVETHTMHIAEVLAKITMAQLDQAWHEGAESATNRPLYGAPPRSPYA